MHPPHTHTYTQVVALRSSQLKAEQALAQAQAAEARLSDAGQQLSSLSAQLSTGACARGLMVMVTRVH